MDTEKPSTAEISTNPLLARARIPGETFTLPSQGLFYQNGELDESVKNGELIVNPMVTFDEIIMKTPDKLFSGEAITEVFKRCIPQVLKPLDLLSKDVDFLLVCLRKVTYGEQMEITYTHTCKDAEEHNYMVSMDPFVRNARRIDPTKIDTDYVIKLENGQQVFLNPPRFGNVLKIYQAVGNDQDMSSEEIRDELFDTLAGMIRKVDNISDKNQVREWLSVIKAGWVEQISTSIDRVSDWGPNFGSTIKCRDCGEEVQVNTPINPLSFFM